MQTANMGIETTKGFRLTERQKFSDSREWWPMDGSSLEDNTTWGRVEGWEVIGADAPKRFVGHDEAFAEMCSRLATDPTANLRPIYAVQSPPQGN